MLRRATVHCTMLLVGCGRIDFDPVGDAGNSAGDNRPVHELKLDRFDPGEQLFDFPVPVILDDLRIDRTVLAADASDLRFFDATGALIPHEVEQVGGAGGPPLVAWVRIPSIVGTTTTFGMAYGGQPGPVSTAPVWSSDFSAVWHLNGTTTERDAAGAFDASVFGPTSVPGILGNAREFVAASSQYLAVPNTSMLAPAERTISAWIRITALPSGFYGLLTREHLNSQDDDIYLGVTGSAVFVACETATGEHGVTGGAIATNAWVHIAGTAVGNGVLHGYHDGSQVTTAVLDGPLLSGAQPVFLGADRGGTSSPGLPDSDFLDGMLDEVRVQSVARSAAWLTYDERAGRDLVITYPPR